MKSTVDFSNLWFWTLHFFIFSSFTKIAKICTIFRRAEQFVLYKKYVWMVSLIHIHTKSDKKWSRGLEFFSKLKFGFEQHNFFSRLQLYFWSNFVWNGRYTTPIVVKWFFSCVQIFLSSFHIHKRNARTHCNIHAQG